MLYINRDFALPAAFARAAAIMPRWPAAAATHVVSNDGWCVGILFEVHIKNLWNVF